MTDTIYTAIPAHYLQAIKTLKAGGLVALPTETVYGLAADARNHASITRLYELKQRPAHNPLIAHILTPQDAQIHAHICPLSQTLINTFWPGPLTLVLPRKTTSLAMTGLSQTQTIALRCPNSVWRKFFHEHDAPSPLFMPSANRSGHISPTSAMHVFSDFGPQIELIIDAGICTGGLESTVVKIEQGKIEILRPGMITQEQLASTGAPVITPDTVLSLESPGLLTRHYAPKARLRLNAHDRQPHEHYLGFGNSAVMVDFNLSPSADLHEAAQHLYDALRRFDTTPSIAIAPIPNYGLGSAINDRLQRAAASK